MERFAAQHGEGRFSAESRRLPNGGTLATDPHLLRIFFRSTGRARGCETLGITFAKSRRAIICQEPTDITGAEHSGSAPIRPSSSNRLVQERSADSRMYDTLERSARRATMSNLLRAISPPASEEQALAPAPDERVPDCDMAL